MSNTPCRERHPHVGCLLACALDDARRSFEDRLLLQCTSTLMEGGSESNSRVYAVGPIAGLDGTDNDG